MGNSLKARALCGGFALLALGSCAIFGPREALKAPLTDADRSAWYAGTQGSRLMPWDWAKALERAGSNEHVFAPANMARLGYIANPLTVGGDLPIGFAIDDHDDAKLTFSAIRWYEGQGTKEKWVGMNCAACHTGQIAHNGQTRLIDGAPSLTDYQGLLEDVNAAMAATAADPAKFARFAAQVLSGHDTPANRTKLAAAFASLNDWNQRIERANHTDLRWGLGRVDAFGRIFNKVALLADPHGEPRNPADAPVSIPFLWQTSQSDVVQWNGIAQNTQIASPLTRERFDYGALGRNTGEMIGVFGDVRVVPGTGMKGYASSLQADSIIRMEGLVARMRAPVWPADWFGKPEAALVAAGETLFKRDCVTCHQEIDAKDVITPYKASMQWFASPLLDPGTDRAMACNAVTYTARTGTLQGVKDGYIDLNGKGVPLGQTAPIAAMLRTLVVGTIVGDAPDVAKSAVGVVFGVPGRPRVVRPTLAPETHEERLKRCAHTTDHLLAYKARPLAGIWATAPYLHNGSVPTLWDLLLPPAERPTTFMVGTREYDPVRVGYRTGADAPGNRFAFDTAPLGNRNVGHDYGNDRLSEDDRRAIVEYLKTL